MLARQRTPLKDARNLSDTLKKIVSTIMRRLLITGGAGFIGVNLIAYLRGRADLDITVVDNLSLGRREHLDGLDVRFIEGDVRDLAGLARSIEGQEAVVHLAADTRVTESIEAPRHNFEVNVAGTFNVLEACRMARLPRIVFASTGGAIIGEAVPPVHERMVAKPISPYGASKLAGEGYLSAYAGSYGMQCTALRFSNVYGPRSFHKGSVVAQFYRNLLAGQSVTVFGDGSQSRDFVYVDDICAGIWSALSRQDGGSQVYQLGSGEPTSVNRLLEMMRAVVAPLRFPEIQYRAARLGEITHSHSDIAHARRGLGFSPATHLADGLSSTWRWFEERAP
jgi:UDP-glucose 4-epimerase